MFPEITSLIEQVKSADKAEQQATNNLVSAVEAGIKDDNTLNPLIDQMINTHSNKMKIVDELRTLFLLKK